MELVGRLISSLFYYLHSKSVIYCSNIKKTLGKTILKVIFLLFQKQLTSFFLPSIAQSASSICTIVCLSKHISKCHLNEILDKSVIICADKRWTST